MTRETPFAALLCLVGTLLPCLAYAESALEESIRALEANDVVGAERAFAKVPSAEREGARALLQRGMLGFYTGRYDAAAQDIDQAIAKAPRSPHVSDWREIAKWAGAARDITREFAQVASPDRRYVVAHEPGVDAVLVDYALDALKRADEAIQARLGIHLPSPIRLEIYPSARSLAEVSSLTLEHIETTGTVALCKWNRLMIASPRSLLYGYPWLDTINHELVHLALTYASHNYAPVWFHEGLAKLFEKTWRGVEPASYLSPATNSLLVDAAHRDRLIPFEQMHPSIAMLPSQEDAALAFAQVVTFLESFKQHQGDRGLTKVIERIAAQEDARDALSQVASQPFATLQDTWKASLLARKTTKGAPERDLKLRVVDGEAPDASLDVQEDRARKHLRLGDLLWGRSRPEAAAREYETGRRFAPSDPILASRVARASLAGERPDQALEALDAALAGHPHHAPLHALRGAALLSLGNRNTATTALRETIRINPFDPAPHCDLAKASADASEAAHEARLCQQLGGGGR